MEGESGRNELLRGPFALFGVRSSAKLEKTSLSTGGLPCPPPQLIPPTSPVQVFAGDGRLRRRFSHTGHGPLRSLIVSNLKWGGPCRATTCFRQADIKIFRNFLKSPLMAYRIFPHTVALSGRDKVRPRT